MFFSQITFNKWLNSSDKCSRGGNSPRRMACHLGPFLGKSYPPAYKENNKKLDIQKC